MNFKKISCSGSVALLECTAPRKDRWAARWGLAQAEGDNYEVFEALFDHRPTIDEIRQVIETQIDEATAERIVNGFSWNGTPVRLTAEAQTNFLFAASVARDRGEIDREQFAGLFHADTDEQAAAALLELVAAMWEHIKTARAAGIEAKRSFNLDPYK